MLQELVDQISATLARLSLLEVIFFAVLLTFTVAGLRGRARRRRQQKEQAQIYAKSAGQHRNARTVAPSDDQLTASKENDLFNEAFGDEFSETCGPGADGGADADADD